MLGVSKVTAKNRPAGETYVELFTFTVSNAKTIIDMSIYFPNYRDVLHCDVSFVSTNNTNLAYGFTQHLQARHNNDYTANVKLYLEKDTSNSSLYHVKAKFSVAVAAAVWFKENYKTETTITYTQIATTIGEGAILLGTTSV